MDSGDGRGKVVVVRGVCEGRSLAGGGTRGSALFAAPDVAGACWLREGWFEAAGRLALADMRGQHASRLAPAMCREKKSTGSARQEDGASRTNALWMLADNDNGGRGTVALDGGRGASTQEARRQAAVNAHTHLNQIDRDSDTDTQTGIGCLPDGVRDSRHKGTTNTSGSLRTHASWPSSLSRDCDQHHQHRLPSSFHSPHLCSSTTLPCRYRFRPPFLCTTA